MGILKGQGHPGGIENDISSVEHTLFPHGSGKISVDLNTCFGSLFVSMIECLPDL